MPESYSADVLAVDSQYVQVAPGPSSSERGHAGYDRNVEPHRAVIDEASATLDDVDQALIRLSDGTYRICEAAARRSPRCGSLRTPHSVAVPTTSARTS